jgi:O-antigen/teichoic acid export membrane protein
VTTLRGLSRDFATYGLGELLIKAFALITFPIYTRAFSPDEYGIMSYVTTLAGLLSATLVLGGDSAYARFFFEAQTTERRQLISSTWIGFLAAWSIAVCAALLPMSGAIADWSFGRPDTTALFSVALLTAPVALINRMCAQVLRNEFRARAYTALNVLSTALTVGLAVTAVLVLSLGLFGVLAGALVAELVMLPIRLWTARTMFRPVFSVPVLKAMLSFGVPIVPTSLAYWVFLTSDRLLLGKLSTLEQLGLYSVANSLVALTAIAITAFGQAWTPHAFRVYEEEPDQAPALYGRVMTYLLAGFGALAVGITAFGPDLLRILTDEPYFGAIAAVGPLALGMVAQASTQVTAGGITLTKRTHYLAIHSWAAAGLNVGLNLALIPPFGMIGSAWATAISYVYLTLAYLVTSQRLWPVAFEVHRSIAIVVATLLIVVGAWIVGAPAAWPSTLAGIAWCVAYAVLLLVSRSLDVRELALVRGWFRAVRR